LETKLIPFEAYDGEIEKLMTLVRDLGLSAPDNAQITREAVEAFKFLYYATFPEERSTDLKEEEARIHVGLGDLATKINKACSKAGSDAIRPHLEKMIQGTVRMNESSCLTDDAANKTCELYVGCLALSRGWSVVLDDPVKSSGGSNPDVIIDRDGQKWSLAVKTIHGHSSQTIFDNISNAARQIENSGKVGIPFINLKNRIQLPASSVYATVNHANSSLSDAMVKLIQQLRDEIVDDDWLRTFKGELARPVVAFMAQALISSRDENSKLIFVPVRQIVSLTVPPLPKEETLARLGKLDCEALNLIIDLNEELQASP
jgi:hypothetical protein